jgi:uncharacterized membrane protein YfcA
MMLEPLVIIELAVLGLFTGFMAGLLGIGGGMIMVPFLTMVLSVRNIPDDLGLKLAIATAMSTIIFTSISSVWAHHQKGAVRWPLVRSLAPGLVLGSMISSLGVFALIKGPFLGFFFALFVAFSATQMFLDRKPKPTRQLPGPVGLLGAGGFIGFLSGLVGAGGASGANGQASTVFGATAAGGGTSVGFDSGPGTSGGSGGGAYGGNGGGRGGGGLGGGGSGGGGAPGGGGGGGAGGARLLLAALK